MSLRASRASRCRRPVRCSLVLDRWGAFSRIVENTMRVFGSGSGLTGRWDLDHTQQTTHVRVQRRSGLGDAAGGQSRTASYYLKFIRFIAPGLAGAAGIWFPSFFLGLAFSYTLIMLIFTLTFINYLTEVVLNTSDNRILLQQPKKNKTQHTARMLGVAEYAGLLALSV